MYIYLGQRLHSSKNYTDQARYEFITLPPIGGLSIAISAYVCLSVCLSARISQKPHVQIYRFVAHVTRGHGLLLL